MFLSASQLEPLLLKRLEKLGDAPGLGLVHFAISVLQAQNSAAGLEWSSTDGHDEGHQDIVKVGVDCDGLSPQLEAWQALTSTGTALSKAQYCAAAHALIQDVLALAQAANEPVIQPAALDAAWQEDSAGGESVSAERFKLSLATLVTACSSDGAPQTAATCLTSLAQKLQGQEGRWQGLVELYGGSAGQQQQASEPSGDIASGAGGGDNAATAATAAADDDDDDLDALLAGGDEVGDRPDVVPASDKSPDASTQPAESKPADGEDEGTSGAGGEGAAADGDGDDDEDAASSLGLSRMASRTSTSSAAPTVDASLAEAGASGGGAANRYTSTKSLLGPELKSQIDRSLSDASSADLDEMPDNLDAMEARQASNAKASTKPARQPVLAGLMASEEGKGNLAEMPMDARTWANFKGKQAGTAAGGGATGRQRNDVVGGGGAAAGRQPVDQHLKGARAGGAAGPAAAAVSGNPLHASIITGSAVRQSMERERNGGNGAAQNSVGGSVGVSRHGSNGSNESPSRQRSVAGSYGSNVSRKLSISEPGPVGQQAEWKHLPALGQASRLHPHALRQASRTALSRGSPTASAAALIDDKLPMLPSLAGARGAPPKAMELLRRPSQMQRNDGHHANSKQQQGQNAHLPGLGAVKGGPQAAARSLRLPSKKSFRGDRDF